MADTENREFEGDMWPEEGQAEQIRQTLLRLLADQRGMEIKGVAIRKAAGSD